MWKMSVTTKAVDSDEWAERLWASRALPLNCLSHIQCRVHTVTNTCLHFTAYSQAPVILNLMFYLLWNNEPLAGSLQRKEHTLVNVASVYHLRTLDRFTCSSRAGETTQTTRYDGFMLRDTCLKKKEQKCDTSIFTFSDNTNKHDGRSAREHRKEEPK